MWLGRRWLHLSYPMVPDCDGWRQLCSCLCFVLECPVLVGRVHFRTSVPILPLFWGLLSGGDILVALRCCLSLSWPFHRAMSWGTCIVIAGMGRFCTLGWICRCMTALPLAWCFIMILWCVAQGWDHRLHLGRCSWILPRVTACFPW